jgi:hypothetical protein
MLHLLKQGVIQFVFAVQILTDAWGTETLVPMNAGLNRWMILVQLPQDIGVPSNSALFFFLLV